MKNWLLNRAKRKLSAALDEQGTLPSSHREGAHSNPELEVCERELLAVDQRLRNAKPVSATPPGLHQAIMKSIERAGSPEVHFRPRWATWTLAASLGALVIFLTIWFFRERPPKTVTTPADLAAAGQVLEMGTELEQQFPATTLAPLTGEWERVNADLTNAARTLLATLP